MATILRSNIKRPMLSRRGFMVGCSSAIAAMAGSRLSHVAFGSPEREPTGDILLTIFLNGGIDGLNVVPVIGGDDRGHYEAARQNIAIPVTGDNAALPLEGIFGLHPAAAPLHELFQDNNLAIVHATGLPSDTRSHFDARKEMELGTPGYKTGSSGWLARLLQSATSIPENATLPALAVGSLQPASLSGSTEAIGINSPKDFSFSGHWRHERNQRAALRKIYSGNSWIDLAGTATLDAVDVLELGDPGDYQPSNGAEYPGGSFGSNLQAVAQMIKMQLGMQLATIDLGGWDTHEYQGNDGQGYFADRLGMLARGLHAFYTDLSGGPDGANSGHRVTTIVMSEFGRTFHQNGSAGTDHGHGNMMLVMGENVNGGKVYGRWPGLSTDQLYEKRDLAITTDYRQVLSEIVIRRFGNPNLGIVFPGYAEHKALDLMAGTDLTPNYDSAAATPSPTPPPTATKEGSGGTVELPSTPTPPPDVMNTPTPNPTQPSTNASPTPVDTSKLEPEVFMPFVTN